MTLRVHNVGKLSPKMKKEEIVTHEYMNTPKPVSNCVKVYTPKPAEVKLAIPTFPTPPPLPLPPHPTYRECPAPGENCC